MALQDNPIVTLGLGVLKGEISINQAIERVASTDFLQTIGEDQIKDIVSLVDAIKATEFTALIPLFYP